MSSSVIFEFCTVVNLLDEMFGLIRGKDIFGFKEVSFLRAVNPRKRDWILIKVFRILGLFFIILAIFFLRFLKSFFGKLYNFYILPISFTLSLSNSFKSFFGEIQSHPIFLI